jgi:hypothetical protein
MTSVMAGKRSGRKPSFLQISAAGGMGIDLGQIETAKQPPAIIKDASLVRGVSCWGRFTAAYGTV